MPKCPKDCKKQNPLIFKKTVIPAIVGNDDVTPPENGAFCNMLVVYEATGNAYLYSSDGVPTLLSTTDYTRLNNLPTINGEIILGDLTLEDLGISQLVEAEAEDRREADTILQTQIDAITASSDVVDIVGTYEELEEYDTSGLTDNDIIKVISDETVGGATTYYRWENHEWVYIGAEGPYYTKNETDALLDQKLDIDALDDALENYYDKTETDALLADKADVADLASKQDKLIAGDNITIDQATNVISAIVPSLDNYYTKQETYSQSEVDDLISGVEEDIPTATSQLTNDSGFLTTVPIATDQLLGGIKVGSGLSITPDGTLSADAQHIDVDTALSTTSTNPVENRVITNALNNKANITDIPTVPTNISAFYNDAGYVTSTTLAQNYYNKTETYTKTEVDNFISGVSSNIPTKTSDLTNDGANGTSTYVERSALATVATSGSYNDLINTPSIPPEMVVLSYGNSTWQEFINAYNTHTVVYCRASSNSNPATGAQNRLAFMAYVSNADNPSNVEFQYYRSVSTKSASQQCDQVYVYTLTPANGGTWTVTIRDANVEVVAGAGLTSVYSNGQLTLATTSAIPTKTSDLTNDSGFITATDYASANTGGTVKIGSGLAIDANGVLSATGLQSVAWNDITGKPTNVSYWTNDAGYITASSLPTKTSDLTNDGSDGTSTYVEADDLATVATSGSYNDLTNKPTIPAAQVNSDWNASSGVAQILNKPTLATVATSGSYNDLSNKPTIPTVNNASLYIQKNGTTVNTFTANQSVDAVANITVPTATSDLTNDSGYITNADLPTKTSDLQNDGSDGTAAYLETDETAYRTTSIPYGECDSTSTSTVFTATVPGITELRDGVCMWLKNGVVTSASGFTININNLGAKPVYSNMAAATRDTTLWNVAYTMLFVYDSDRVEGGCWVLYRGYDANTNTIGYQLRTNSQTMPMSSITYRYRLLFTSADGEHYVPANNSTSTNATASRTVCQDKIDPFGAIFYYGTTASVAAGSRPAAAYLWQQYAISLGYSFNRTGAALTLTSWKPVYVKAAPQSDGSAIIDSTTPYVQDLPTTEDGEIYIFLGIAYSATNIELEADHPVYYYKDGAIRLWTNDAASISSVAWGDITGTLSSQTDLNTALGAKANSADLATVATSGSYNDLTNKPTIPTVNNATLTIQRNNTNVATFTANASSNVTANISVPTATSDLTNDSGFITSITKITNAEIDAIMGVA